MFTLKIQKQEILTEAQRLERYYKDQERQMEMKRKGIKFDGFRNSRDTTDYYIGVFGHKKEDLAPEHWVENQKEY